MFADVLCVLFYLFIVTNGDNVRYEVPVFADDM